MTLPYKAIEHPQAFLHAAALTQMTGSSWELYAAGEISLLYQSGDDAGQAVSTNGSTITFAEPGVYVLRVSATYIADLSEALVTHGKLTLDDSSLSQPTEQAIAEGAQFSENSLRQLLAFERAINVDSTLTVGLWVQHLAGATLEGDITITSLVVEVERVGEPSYPLPGFWNVNASDAITQASLQASSAPVADGAAVDTIIRREGAGNWAQATGAQQATYEVDGFNSILPGLSLVGTDPNWYQLDAQASSFNGDPDFVYFEVFDAPASGNINTLLCLANVSSEYCYIAETSSNLSISRNGSSGLDVRATTGAPLVNGRNWILVSRDSANAQVSMWVNSTTPAVLASGLSGGTLNPTELTLGTYRDSSPTITLSSTRVIRRSHLAVGKQARQSHVDAIHRMLTRWGEI